SVNLIFLAITDSIVTHLTGRRLTKQWNSLGIIQTIIWTVGMGIMSISMHIQGLLGGPRRSSFSDYGGTAQAHEWGYYQLAQAVGGTILFIGIILMVYLFIKMASFAPKCDDEYPIA